MYFLSRHGIVSLCAKIIYCFFRLLEFTHLPLRKILRAYFCDKTFLDFQIRGIKQLLRGRKLQHWIMLKNLKEKSKVSNWNLYGLRGTANTSHDFTVFNLKGLGRPRWEAAEMLSGVCPLGAKESQGQGAWGGGGGAPLWECRTHAATTWEEKRSGPQPHVFSVNPVISDFK